MNAKSKRGGKGAAGGGPGSDLRRQAEQVATGAAASPPRAALPPEEAGRLMHELQVHQIELQMQNEELRRTQLTLDTERARHFDLYDLAPAGYLLLDEQGVIRQANFKAAAMLGVDRGALVQRPFSRFILREDQDIYYRQRKQLGESGSEQSCELRMGRPDGTQVWVKLLASTTPAAEGSEATVRIIATEIGERKQAEQALRESEDRYRALVEWSPDAIGVHRDGHLLYVNPAAARMLGARTQQELVGKRILDFVRPDDHALVVARRTDFLDRGRAAPTAELRFLKLDGSPFEVEIESATIDFDGKPATYSVLHDASARKRADAALREGEARYRTVLNASPDSITLTDLEGRIQMASPAALAMTGYEQDSDVLGRLIADFVAAEDRDRATAIVARLFRSTQAETGEFLALRRDGSTFDAEANFDFIRDSEGNRTGMVFVFRDISARKQAEAKVRRLTLLYATLSQCNQAIVRCSSDAELFPQICRDMVTVGGMKTAWIALLDKSGERIEPFAVFGAGGAERHELNITAKGDEPGGRGPTGTAIRENRPVWCQDFLHDPNTAPWHECGARIGWAATASLPLHRYGEVVGALTLCAGSAHYFDEEVRALLQGMALDIGFAMDSYARDAARKSAEEKLRESEAFNAAILNSVIAEIAVVDPDGVIIAVNEPWQRFARDNGHAPGVPAPNTGVGANYFAVCQACTGADAADAARARDGIRAVMTGKRARFRMEYACHSPDRQRWFTLNVTKFGGRAGGAVVAHGDITERKLSQLAFDQTNQRFRDLVDSTDGIVWEADASTFNFNFVSGNAERLLGYPNADWLQPGFWAAHIHAEDREPAVQYCAARTGLRQDHDFEYRFIAKDGRVVWLADIVKVVEQDGKPRWLRGLMLDITERKRIESQLRTLSRAIEQSPVTIVITDRDGIIEYVNPRFEQVTGYTRDEAIGQNPRILQSGLTPLEVYQQMWAAIAAGGDWSGELCNRRKNGELFWEFVTLSGVKNHAGQIEHFIAVKEDISERKLAEARKAEFDSQLRESQKMQAIGTLAGGIAHDFNNILATILGNVDLAREDTPSTNPVALDSLHEIRKAAQRARDLVQQILSFSRRQPDQRRPIMLADVVDESMRLLRAVLPARLSLRAHYPADLPAVRADAAQLQQVLVNLITNAMQAIPEGNGQIDVRLDVPDRELVEAASNPDLRALYERHAGAVVRLTVRDNGIGMDAATAARIFEPFFTTKPVDEGTGLGLSVVHGIVMAHGGAITVESTPGQGSCFSVFLPADDAPAGSRPPQVVEDKPVIPLPPPAPAGGRRILFIDDDESLVYLVERVMARRDFLVRAFTDAADALDLLRADPAAFDLVVTDYNMPGMSGLDVAREVRTIRADLPVAVASGFIDEALLAQAEEAGVREVIFKANAVEDLCDAFVRLARTMAGE